MIAVLAYWLLLLFIFLPAGLFTSKFLRLKTESLPIHILFGMFAYTFVFTGIAFFTGLGAWAIIAAILLSLVSGIIYRRDFAMQFHIFSSVLKNLLVIEKTALLLLITAVVLKSAQLPTIIDNETYYIQTIKWINQYGFVKGLSNLHLFLGQMSPWHVLHAGLGFDGFNDLNGFLFTICTLYYFTQNRSTTNGWLIFIPMLSVVFLFFTDSPSPDLPLLMVVPIVLHHYLKGDIKPAWIFFLFIAFIKITIAPLGLVFLYPLFKERKHWLFIIASALAVGFIWIIKNIIITGYPLYPFTSLQTGVDWQVPEHLLNSVHETSNKYIYGTADTSYFIKITSWLMMGGVDGFFNKLILLLFIIVPCFRKIREQKKFTILYLALLAQFVLLLFTSPQFRFFLPTVVFFLAFIGYETLTLMKLRLYNALLAFGVIIVLVVVSKDFSASQLYKPEAITAYNTLEFKQDSTGNLKYYTPDGNFFLYGTADGPLPCVNQKQVKLFEKKYKVMPQLRGKDLEGGFYSKPVAVK